MASDHNLRFGTAGLRGPVGENPCCFNRTTIRRIAQGLAGYITRQPRTSANGVIVSYDTRQHSFDFAREAAKVIAANGIKVHLFDGPRPAPQLSYAVRKLKAQAGLAITASHNPPQYNGCKIYWADGAQILPGLACAIGQEIDRANFLNIPNTAPLEQGRIVMLDSSLDDRYRTAIKRCLLRPDLISSVGEQLKVLYTPLFGTGSVHLPQLLREVGFSSTLIIKEESTPYISAGASACLNPEELSAFEVALRQAHYYRPDIILATDPDADRVGVLSLNSSGRYAKLSGTEVGVLLLNYLLDTLASKRNLSEDHTVLKSAVTNELGTAVAGQYGVITISTPVGFKYIGNYINQIAEQNFLFGYEESCGYLVGTYARDKDAISAALLICEMALHYKKDRGLSLWEVLEHIYRQYGYYQDQVFTKAIHPEQADEIMARLRSSTPRAIGGLSVDSVVDYLDAPAEQKCNLIGFVMEDKSRLFVRPSGTEPKLKMYLTAIGSSRADAASKMQSLSQGVLDLLETLSR